MPSCYVLTTHAIRRFQERVRPGLDWMAAEHDLMRLLRHGELVTVAPAWIADRQREASPAYLVVDDIVFPLSSSRSGPGRWVLKTRLTRGGISDAARQQRSARRAGRRRPPTDSRSRANRRPANAVARRPGARQRELWEVSR